MRNRTPFAPDDVREQIIRALRDPGRRFFRHDDSTSRRYLDRWGITGAGLFEDLADDLEHHHLYLKPKAPSDLHQNYQYLITYPGAAGCEAILVHVTLAPRGEPPRVRVAVHPHNTGYAPLPRIPIQKP